MSGTGLLHNYWNRFIALRGGLRALALAHLGQSDHVSLLLIPAYTPIRR